jgi:hypothetical protein
VKTRVMPFALIAAIVIGPAVRHARPAPKQDAPAQDPLTVRVVTRVPESIEGRREPTTAFFVELLMGAGSTPGGVRNLRRLPGGGRRSAGPNH